jgi:hypothetical protein
MNNTLIKFILFLAIQTYASKLVEDTGSSYYNGRIENNKTTPKVYDILHKYLPNLHDYWHLHDMFTLLMILPIFYKLEIVKDYLGYWMVIFLIRIVTTSSTILPKYKECSENCVMFGGCYDKLFSGHFSSVLLATLLYMDNKMITLPIALVMNITNAMLILLVRSHYTVDVIMAFFVTMFVYQNGIKI